MCAYFSKISNAGGDIQQSICVVVLWIRFVIVLFKGYVIFSFIGGENHDIPKVTDKLIEYTRYERD